MKINLGCGKSKNEGYVNVDADSGVGPDIVMDFANSTLPWKNSSVDEITCFHCIEHIPRDRHQLVFGEINRVLKIGGTLVISYPDAERCAKNFLENKHGMRDYWEMALLGRGNTHWDMHRCLIVTSEMLSFLREFGFGRYKVMEEAGQYHNTVIQTEKTFSVTQIADALKRSLDLDATSGHDSSTR